MIKKVEGLIKVLCWFKRYVILKRNIGEIKVNFELDL